VGVIGIQRKQAPNLHFPLESIGQSQHIMYVKHNDPWQFTGLTSLSQQLIAIETGVSYGVFDTYLNRYQLTTSRVQPLSGQDTLNRRVALLDMGRVDMFLADKNVVDNSLSQPRKAQLRKAGALPPDNLYVAFGGTNAKRYSQMITNGMLNLRKSGNLAAILSNYQLSDWKNWYQEYHYTPAPKFTASKTSSTASKTKRIMYLVSSVSKESSYWIYANHFKQLVEARSKGDLIVKLRFGQDSEHNIVMDLAEGKTHMGLVASNNIAPYSPTLGAFTLPYLFSSIDGAKRVFGHPIMAQINERVSNESGVRPISFLIGGYRKLLNNVKPVTATADLKELRIRVPNNHFMVEAFRAWGVEPIPIAWPDVFPALERGEIDGKENPINVVFAGLNQQKNVWESLTYVTNLHYFLFTAPHLISESFYQQLTPQQQEIIRQSAQQAATVVWDKTLEDEQRLIDFAKTKGMIFAEPRDEESDWKAKAHAIWPTFYHRAGGKPLVDEVVNIIEQSGK
jgi:TRAP-type C4-dicarboxylate transport system substrate-binding protein